MCMKQNFRAKEIRPPLYLHPVHVFSIQTYLKKNMISVLMFREMMGLSTRIFTKFFTIQREGKSLTKENFELLQLLTRNGGGGA